MRAILGGITYARLWLEARARVRDGWLPAGAPLGDVKHHADLVRKVAAGEPISLMGEAIQKPAVALGRVLARQVDKRVVPGSLHIDRWVSADETREGEDVTAAYTFDIRQFHGWRDALGRLRIYGNASEHLRNPYVGEVGDDVLVVYDCDSERHLVLSLKPDGGRVRTAFRTATTPAEPSKVEPKRLGWCSWKVRCRRVGC